MAQFALDYRIEILNCLTIASGSKTDWFVDHLMGRWRKAHRSCRLFRRLVRFQHEGTGAFYLKMGCGRADVWPMIIIGRSCHSNFSDKHPTMVTVVTRGPSDDCNSVPSGDIGVLADRPYPFDYVFYYSTDGSSWKSSRTFNLTALARIGLDLNTISRRTGSKAVFSEIHYSPKKIANVYTERRSDGPRVVDMHSQSPMPLCPR